MTSRTPVSARDFLVRGLLAGMLAGIAAFAVAFVVGEPSVRVAIALESSADPVEEHEHAEGTEEHSHAEEAEVPRSLQSSLGLLSGTAIAGAALGGLVGVLSALALGRFGRLGPRATTMLITGIGFTAVSLAPFVAYPPNPPAVGQGETIGYRTALYFILMAISVLAAVTATLIGRRLSSNLGAWRAGLIAVGGYLVAMVVTIAAMPSYNEVPEGFPATVLYEFRAASLLTQLTLWAVLGVVLAGLVGRLVRAPAAEQALVTADR